MNLYCKNYAPGGWFMDEVFPEEWAAIKSSDLLYLHNLLAGVERRLILLVGEEIWERDYDNFREFIRARARLEGEGWTAVNYEKLREIVRDRERAEIAQLTGRAA